MIGFGKVQGSKIGSSHFEPFILPGRVVGGAAISPGEQHFGMGNLLVERRFGVVERTFTLRDLREVEIKQIA